MIDSTLQQQLQDYAKQYADYRYANYGRAKGLGDEANAGANLQISLDTPKNLQKILDLSGQYNFGPEHLNMLKGVINGDAIQKQALDEYVGKQNQLAQQTQQLQGFRNQAETQAFGGTGLNLNQALTSTGGDLGNLNKFLGQQQAETFNTQLKPLIQMSLGSQGLSDSGANIELQSKALAQLEQARQQNMMQAALGARGQIQSLGRSDLLGNIGYSQDALNNQADLQRTGIAMQFQRDLESQREQLTQQLMQRRGGGGNSLMSQILGGAGMAASIVGAPFTGGTSLMALPGFAGMALGGGGLQSGMLGAQGAAQLGSSFFANRPSKFEQPSIMPSPALRGYGPYGP